MKAKFIYEAFSEKGDPIKDMGIGSIKFEDEYFRIYKDEEIKLWRKWNKFFEDLKGKWIEGRFDRYDTGEHIPVFCHAKIKIDEYVISKEGLVNFTIKNPPTTYHTLDDERYILHEE